jgi:hypothetical protein
MVLLIFGSSKFTREAMVLSCIQELFGSYLRLNSRNPKACVVFLSPFETLVLMLPLVDMVLLAELHIVYTNNTSTGGNIRTNISNTQNSTPIQSNLRKYKKSQADYPTKISK